MTTGSLKVINGGIFTTVQDRGRFGFRKFGIPQSGAMDLQALHYGNWLVHNPLDSPVLECTLQGGKYFFETSATMALTGAVMDVMVNKRSR